MKTLFLIPFFIVNSTYSQNVLYNTYVSINFSNLNLKGTSEDKSFSIGIKSFPQNKVGVSFGLSYDNLKFNIQKLKAEVSYLMLSAHAQVFLEKYLLLKFGPSIGHRLSTNLIKSQINTIRSTFNYGIFFLFQDYTLGAEYEDGISKNFFKGNNFDTNLTSFKIRFGYNL